MKTDIEIAQEVELETVFDLGEKLGLSEYELEAYGRYKGKISLEALKNREDKDDGKLILVTSINPTPAGEGKTTVNIGLSMALNKIGKKAISALREPSLGPSFGMKGGACGGGYSQVLPMEDINMHFTGDMHAITTSNNLICAMLDNHIHQGNDLGIDPNRVRIKRCLDLNDRNLRDIVIGLGGPANGQVREDGFDISVATEMMAILCLSKDLQDLKERVGNILVAYTYDKKPVYAKDLEVQGSVALLMKDAIKPNLVQTIEHTPAIIHGGPFANIAHGCNSITATKMALKLSDYTVTEAGFGADLGAEKFMDIKCRYGGLTPDVTVIVATIRGLKHHGGVKKEDYGKEDLEALERGFSNLARHIDNMKKYGPSVLVAINSFPTDTENEVNKLRELCLEKGVKAIPVDVFNKGGQGGIDLAQEVVNLAENEKTDFNLLYEDDLPLVQKIKKIAQEIYGAKDLSFTKRAMNTIKEAEDMGLGNLPVCMAKTQYSFSDDKDLLGAPEDFTLHISEVRINSGAGFIVCLTGNIMTMPGLPKRPAACDIDVKEDGEIIGLF